MKNLYQITKTVMDEWENPFGWAPDSAAQKIHVAMKSWIVQMTDCLQIWEQKGVSLTEGELILANANLGSLVESWLKFFYCVYYEDYLKNPTVKKGSLIEPNELKFEDLKIKSRGILWKQGDNWDKWVERMQQRRNAIHAFNFREIGSGEEYIENMRLYYQFVNLVIGKLPDSPASAREFY